MIFSCRKIYLLIAFVFISISSLPARQISDKDKEIFEQYGKYMQENNLQENDIIKTAIFFIGTPYAASTLEKNAEEQLVINLREFDCITFIESCIALESTKNKDNIELFHNNLQNIRYRDGFINGYSSRLHYVSDWIYNNSQNKLITDITQDIGGIPFPLSLSFMSENASAYPALASNTAELNRIKEIEQIINARANTSYYLPKGKILENVEKIQSGDIIFFTTSIKGLDTTHAGIAYRHNGVLSFIHASSKHKKVIINPEPLDVYCQKSKSTTGVIVVRHNKK